jgi:acyl-coenzyme A thioesterase PaaI-like protein
LTDDASIVDGHAAARRLPARGATPGPELRAVVDALRDLIDQVVRTEAPVEDLIALAGELQLCAERLRPHTPKWEPSVPAAILSTDDPHVYFPFSPQIGEYNPLAPPVLVQVDGTEVRGSGTLGAAFEGPPGCVHGGIIASLFDEILGVANIASGNAAMTGTLTIRYRAPTPLEAELTLSARTTARDGRKVYAAGEIRAGDLLCAEAEGIFVEVNPRRFLKPGD